MKQYLTQEQTTKLIELGFAPKMRIKGVCTKYGTVNVENETYFDVGKLIEMLPLNRIEFDLCAYVDTTGGLFYDDELIDALFKACVKLKEEGVI